MTLSTDPVVPEASTWAPLHRTAFRTLWIASFVSNIGTWMQTLLAALTITGHMTPVLLLVLTFLLGCGAAAQLPAFQAFVPDLVPRTELGQAASLSSIAVNLARVVGPAVAGLLVTRIGVGGLFALNAATFLLFALALQTVHAPARAPVARQAFLSGIEAGGRYVRHAPVVRRILARLVVFAVPANILWALLAPVAHDRLGLGPTGYGVMLGAAGVGSVAGALLLPRLRRRLSASWLVGPAGVTAPVLVSLRYHVPAEHRDEFLAAMHMLRDSRLRTGGTGWALYRDGRDDGAYVEQFTVASFEEHRQQHELRLTGLDRQVQERIGGLADRTGDVAHLFLVKQ